MDQGFSLRVVAFQDGDVWIAQGLERDICVQAPTEEALIERFSLTLDAELNESAQRGDDAPLGSIPAAPSRFRDLWIQNESKTVKSYSVGGQDVEMALCA